MSHGGPAASSTLPQTKIRRRTCVSLRTSNAAKLAVTDPLNSSRNTTAPWGTGAGSSRAGGGPMCCSASTDSRTPTPQHLAVAIAAISETTQCRPTRFVCSWYDPSGEFTRRRRRSGQVAETSSAHTPSDDEPKNAVRQGTPSAIETTRSSSWFNTARPFAPRPRTSLPFSAATFSSEPKPSRCRFDMPIARTMSGRIIHDERHILPGIFIPTSRTAKRWRGRIFSRTRGSPWRPLSTELVPTISNRLERMA